MMRLTEAVGAATEETGTVRGKLHNAIRKGKTIEKDRAEAVARVAALEQQLLLVGGDAAADAAAAAAAVADAAQLRTLKQRVQRLEEELQVPAQCVVPSPREPVRRFGEQSVRWRERRRLQPA